MIIEREQPNQKYIVRNKGFEKYKRWQENRWSYVDRSKENIYLLRKRGDKYRYPIAQFERELPIFGSEKILEGKFAYSSDREEKEQDYIIDFITENNKRSWLVVMKTGRGKTHVLMRIINSLQEKTLIVVHSQMALRQMKASIKKFCWFDVGVYYSKKKDIKEITITTKNSLVASIDLFKWLFGVVLVDEADTYLNPELKKKSKRAWGWYHYNMIDALCDIDTEAIFWFTGTPDHKELWLHGMKLLFWDIIKMPWQKNNGYNYLPNIKQIIYSWGSNSFIDPVQAREAVMSDELRIRLQFKYISDKYKRGEFKYCIMMLERVSKECVPYYERFQEMHPDITSIMIHGKTKTKDDNYNIEKLKRAWSWIVVCSIKKMGRGIDIPMLDTIFVLFPRSSNAAVVQACGRILRKWENKKPNIYDRNDNYGFFKAQAKKRKVIYKNEYIWCDIVEEKIDESYFKYTA